MQGGRRHDSRGWPGIDADSQDIENDIGGMDALAQCLERDLVRLKHSLLW